MPPLLAFPRGLHLPGSLPSQTLHLLLPLPVSPALWPFILHRCSFCTDARSAQMPPLPPSGLCFIECHFLRGPPCCIHSPPHAFVTTSQLCHLFICSLLDSPPPNGSPTREEVLVCLPPTQPFQCAHKHGRSELVNEQ